MLKIKILLEVYLCINIIVLGSTESPQVEINQGILRGVYRKTLKGKIFSSFTGIPYAKPPIGKFRFQPPVPAGNWNGILDASKPHSICPQTHIYFNDLIPKGNEDCLYLNIYTPQQTGDVKSIYPVMVYIHGGGWMCGSANPSEYGPDILLDQNVVLVTLNYRLGALGFLSTGDEVVAGNNGLKDQSLALKWIKQNIKHFGGDPNKITIFGQSAGGASVNYHMFSPLSKDLFSGAIAHSGIAFALWSNPSTEQTIKNSKKLAKYLNCPSDVNKEMVECLRDTDAYDIVEHEKQLLEWSYDPMVPFKPIIEINVNGAFLAEDPIDILKSGRFTQVPFITGFATSDGSIKSAALYNDSNLITELNNNFHEIAPLLFQYNNSDGSKSFISEKIRKFYFNNRNIDSSTKTEVTNMFTDAFIMSSQNFAVELHSKYSEKPVYQYLFGYRGSVSFSTLFGDASHDYGVCHGDDLLYLLSSNLFDHFPQTQSDKNMIDIMTTLWTNFAKTGNPTPTDDSLIQTKWEPINKKMQYYFIESDKNIKMINNIYIERENFWRRLPIGYFEKKNIKDEL